MFAHFRHHLRAQIRSAIEHRHDDARDAHLIVHAGIPDLLHHAHDFNQPFEREKFALNRREQFVGGGERIRHQNAERGRAIEQDEIESRIGAQGRQSFAETREMIIHPRDFDFRAGQIEIRRDDEHPVQTRRQNLVRDRARPR